MAHGQRLFIFQRRGFRLAAHSMTAAEGGQDREEDNHHGVDDRNDGGGERVDDGAEVGKSPHHSNHAERADHAQALDASGGFEQDGEKGCNHDEGVEDVPPARRENGKGDAWSSSLAGAENLQLAVLCRQRAHHTAAAETAVIERLKKGVTRP